MSTHETIYNAVKQSFMENCDGTFNPETEHWSLELLPGATDQEDPVGDMITKVTNIVWDSVSQSESVIRSQIAQEMLDIIDKRKPLDEKEEMLLNSLRSEIGVKYGLLPPVKGFHVEARQQAENENTSKNWF